MGIVLFHPIYIFIYPLDIFIHRSMTFLNKNSVLVLNSLFYPIGITSPQKALIAMCSLESPARALDVTYGNNPDGSYNTNMVLFFQPLAFEEWINLPLREGVDTRIHTSRLVIRTPTVLITSYNKIPKKRFRPTKKVLFELQSGKCGYSGKELPFSQMNIEHKHARSHGGKNTFQNLMVVDKKINFARGNKPLEAAGLRPLFNHKEPMAIPVSATFKNILHPDWKMFVEVK